MRAKTTKPVAQRVDLLITEVRNLSTFAGCRSALQKKEHCTSVPFNFHSSSLAITPIQNEALTRPLLHPVLHPILLL